MARERSADALRHDVVSRRSEARPGTDHTLADVAEADSSPGISLVIVNRNTRTLLYNLLSSVFAHPTSRTLQTIVVDNASTDGSTEAVAASFPHVEVLPLPVNLGYAAANNRGIDRAHGDFILLINSDCVVMEGAVDAMARCMDRHPNVAVVGPLLTNPDGSLQSSMRDFPWLLTDAAGILDAPRWPIVGGLIANEIGRRQVSSSSHERSRTVDWVSGACMLVRRTALESAGAFDEGYFFFTEELDLCYRLEALGWSVLFCPDARVMHIGGQTANQMPAARLLWHYRGVSRFYRLHRSKSQQAVIHMCLALSAIAHLAWLALRYRRSTKTRPLFNAYVKALLLALRTPSR